MLELLQLLATLADIDDNIAYLREELGDLPIEVEAMETLVSEKQKMFDDAQQQLDDVLKFRANAVGTIQDSKDKQKRLSEQQFQVRNNREFDAITKEIATMQEEGRNLEKEIAASHIKEENFRRSLVSQETDLKESKIQLSAKEAELSELSSDQNEEFSQYLKRRSELVKQIPTEKFAEYERIRTYHKVPVVMVRRGSCTGCFSSVPPQKVVEMRKYKEVATCEHCGRIMYPEDMPILG